MPTPNGNPYVSKDSTKFDDLPLDIRSNHTNVETQRIQYLFACIGIVFHLVSKTLKAIKENQFIFN